MIDSERFKLLYGPYLPPKCKLGDKLLCEYRDREVTFKAMTETSCWLSKPSKLMLAAQTTAWTIPPSTRKAAPSVADASGLQTQTIMFATSSTVANRFKSEVGRPGLEELSVEPRLSAHRFIFDSRRKGGYLVSSMKRFRLSTLILLVVIATLIFALIGERWHAARREAILEARLAQANEVMAEHYSLGFIEIADKPDPTNQKKK
jgi:hypothetical protein